MFWSECIGAKARDSLLRLDREHDVSGPAPVVAGHHRGLDAYWRNSSKVGEQAQSARIVALGAGLAMAFISGSLRAMVGIALVSSQRGTLAPSLHDQGGCPCQPSG